MSLTLNDHVVTSEIDPFSREFLADPYPYHERLREAGPVVRLARYDAWAVFRHEQVQAILNDWQTFSSGAGVGLANFHKEGNWRPPSLLLETDPPAHTRARTVMNRVLSPSSAVDTAFVGFQLSLTPAVSDQAQGTVAGSDAEQILEGQTLESAVATDQLSPLGTPDEDGRTSPMGNVQESSPQQGDSTVTSFGSVADGTADTDLFADDGVCDSQMPVGYNASDLPSSAEELLDALHSPNGPPQAGSVLTVTASGTIDVWDFQPQRLAERGICGLIIQGTDDTDDTLVVDLSRGDLPIPITFHGGTGGYDTLIIKGMSTGSYTPGAVFGDGTIQAGATSISFTGLEPVFIDGASPSLSTFTFTTPRRRGCYHD